MQCNGRPTQGIVPRGDIQVYGKGDGVEKSGVPGKTNCLEHHFEKILDSPSRATTTGI